MITRMQHYKHGKFQYLFLVPEIFQLVFAERTLVAVCLWWLPSSWYCGCCCYLIVVVHRVRVAVVVVVIVVVAVVEVALVVVVVVVIFVLVVIVVIVAFDFLQSMIICHTYPAF